MRGQVSLQEVQRDQIPPGGRLPVRADAQHHRSLRQSSRERHSSDGVQRAAEHRQNLLLLQREEEAQQQASTHQRPRRQVPRAVQLELVVPGRLRVRGDKVRQVYVFPEGELPQEDQEQLLPDQHPARVGQVRGGTQQHSVEDWPVCGARCAADTPCGRAAQGR